MEGIKPIHITVQSLTQPLSQKPSVHVQLTSLVNRSVEADVSLTLPEGWEGESKSEPLSLNPGEIKNISFKIQKATSHDTNQYVVKATVRGGKEEITKTQIIQVACARKVTPVINGSLSDWRKSIPVTIDSLSYQKTENWARYLLNPNLKLPPPPQGKRIMAKIYTGYDKNNFYLAASVEEPSFSQKASVGPDDYSMLWDGGDAIQIAFGLDKPTPWGFPYQPRRGIFADTHYNYILALTKDGPMVVRLHSPKTPLRTFYPQNDDYKYFSPVKGAKLVVKRDEENQVTTYECSIPLIELKELQPFPGGTISFCLCHS
ncbi:MAG TPA: hypothetical protein EYP78_02990 [Candidatus Omnitrophica bacterium]|nr:hypothetical protein [Candidatus Omnitrophota bacterium]